ncbi:sugar ABC transporter ATP-binding protein [Mesorhizobium zhangyense]|nr:sugar ABC transporter ATP-binding protein [Mesorhizobium zhangyense]
MRLENVEKHYAGTHALKEVSLDLRAGEIHAIVGENGAGKSTLIKILTGATPRSSGGLVWDGAAIDLNSPGQASALGIYAVHQEMMLCPHLSVAANIFLGAEKTRFGFSRSARMIKAANEILMDLGFDLDPTALLSSLSIGRQQLVAIARASLYGSRLIIFDEPTAYLTRTETDQLFRLIRRLKSKGVTLVYISHRMEEIFELADRVSVLRDGRLVSTRQIGETTSAKLISEMVARPVGDAHHKEEVALGAPILEVANLTGPGFKDVSLTLRSGEIVGLFGLIGAGRSEFVRALFGRTHATAGVVRKNGNPVKIRNESDAIAAGIALIPESRRYQGLCLNLDIQENLSLTNLPQLARYGLLDRQKERRAVERWMTDLRIVAGSRLTPVGRLSGGNQQKIVIGKWLAHGADIYIFDEPTVGVDVATKAEIYRIIAGLLHAGAGVIIISSYLPEVYDLADTLHVFRQGSLVSTHSFKAVSQDRILATAIGA